MFWSVLKKTFLPLPNLFEWNAEMNKLTNVYFPEHVLHAERDRNT